MSDKPEAQPETLTQIMAQFQAQQQQQPAPQPPQQAQPMQAPAPAPPPGMMMYPPPSFGQHAMPQASLRVASLPPQPDQFLNADVSTPLGYDAFLDAMIDHTYFIYPNLRGIPRPTFLQHLKHTYSKEQVLELQKLMKQEQQGSNMSQEAQLEAGIIIARPDLADKPEELENVKRLTALMQAQTMMAMQQQQQQPQAPTHGQQSPRDKQ